MTQQEALYQTIHKNKKPLKAIAEEIGVSANYLDRAALPDQEDSDTGTGCRFPLKKLIPLIRSTNDYSVLDVTEHSLGRVGILLPPPGKMSTAAICRLTMTSVKKFGDLVGEVEFSLRRCAPWAIERWRAMPDKINYCDSVGTCTTRHHDDELNCSFFTRGETNGGGCILRSWFDSCMSPDARRAAKLTTKEKS